MLFHERLKMLREKRNITQKELALVLGITPSNYQKYEYGKVEPSLQNIEKLCRLFSVPADYLLGYTDNPTCFRNYIVPDGIALDDIFEELCVLLNKFSSNDVSRAFNSLLFFCRHLLSEYLHSKSPQGVLRDGKIKISEYSEKKYNDFRKQLYWETDSLLKAVYQDVYQDAAMPVFKE